jgi:hypothetical protein
VVGGLDAPHSPSALLPALGLRGGLELADGRSRWSLGVSATALADVYRSTAPDGEKNGGATFSLGVATGYRLR